MTLAELIETNHTIGNIHVDVRTSKNGHLIKSYHIGQGETEDRYADGNTEARWITINKPINYKDIGKDYWGVFTTPIPKSLLKLTVANWQLWQHRKCGINYMYQLYVHVYGKDPYIDVTPEHKQSKGIIGQICIDEFIGGDQ